MGTPWKLDTHDKLLAAGYQFLEDAPCKSPICGKTVKWFLTPKGKQMPFDQNYIPHFSTCPSASDFTSRGKKASAA